MKKLAAELPLIAVQAGLLLFVFALSARATRDPDLFFHLRTGEEILRSHELPRTDTLSRAGLEEGKQNIAYSWLFEVVIAGLFRWLTWVGPKLYVATLGALIALLFMGEMYSSRHPKWLGTLYLFIALVALSTVLSPRPWLWSLFLGLVQLKLLFAYRASGRLRLLAWLFPLYALWANLHIQFVMGLIVIGIFALDETMARRSKRAATLVMTATACAGATLLNPYGFGLWETVFQYLSQMELLIRMEDTSPPTPPTFTSLPELAALFLVLAAGWAAYRATQDRLLYALCLFVAMGAFLHSRRDMWFLVSVAVVILARARGFTVTPAVWPRYSAFSAVLAVVFFFAGGFGRLLEDRVDRASIEEKFPVAAAGFVRGHLGSDASPRLKGPLYNSFDWGGYLIWALPELPVSIDGRTNVHGEERVLRHWSTWEIAQGWKNDPDLRTANVVLLERDAPLARFLERDPGMKKVYEDPGRPGAVVFSRAFEKE